MFINPIKSVLVPACIWLVSAIFFFALALALLIDPALKNTIAPHMIIAVAVNLITWCWWALLDKSEWPL